MSRPQHYKEQHHDPEILPCLERAIDVKEKDQVPVCFYIKNGFEVRKWRPPDVFAEYQWTVNQ